jgi:hypothetical protein
VINLLFTIFQYDEYYIYDHFSADTLESWETRWWEWRRIFWICSTLAQHFV